MPLDHTTLWKIGLALAEIGSVNGSKPRVILGRDTRLSGEWIAGVLEAAFVNSGVSAISDVGVITTPGLAYLTRLHRCDLGIMISASHNPYLDNGIKIFGPDGFKLSDDQEAVIEKLIDTMPRPETPTGEFNETGRFRSPQLTGGYIAFLKSQSNRSFAPLRIGLDVCNGAAHAIAREVFEALEAEVSVINDQPDGRNINLNCGSLHLSSIRQLVKEQRLDFGVAFDGDADRSLFVSSSGRILDGDSLLYLLALDFQERGLLKTDKIVGTIMSNHALEQVLRAKSIHLLRAPVGDRYVLELMKRVGANLGGEPSGHVILSDYHTAGDGILTAVKVAEIMAVRQAGLDRLVEGFCPYPQILEGLQVRNKVPLDASSEIRELILAAEERLKGKGRLVVRYSGTEPLLRIMAEGEDGDQVRALVSSLKEGLARIISGG